MSNKILFTCLSSLVFLLITTSCTGNNKESQQKNEDSNIIANESITESEMSSDSTSKMSSSETVSSQMITSSVSSTNSRGDNVMSSVDSKPVFSGDVTIYKISRESFYTFLEKPSYDNLRNNDSKSYIFPKNGDWYLTWNVARFPVKNQFINFAGSSVELKKYLLQNNINDDIVNVAIFEAPRIPMTIWIKTSKENVYITINEDSGEYGTYVYKLYKQSTYYEKFKRRDCKLIVRGNDITNGKSIKLYYDYADLPFTAVMKALGANVKWQSETKATITFKDKNYYLDTTNEVLYEDGEEKDNILHKVTGGPTFIYYLDNELFVDSDTLRTVSYLMGEKIIVKCNMDKETVNID